MSPVILTLLALAAVAVLAGVAFVVMGKGGELARFEADHPPLDLPADRPLSGSDVSRVLLPLALWGYHVRAVDDVLRRVVGALSERDARIADLERRLAEAEATGACAADSGTAPTAVLDDPADTSGDPGAPGLSDTFGPSGSAGADPGPTRARTGAYPHPGGTQTPRRSGSDTRAETSGRTPSGEEPPSSSGGVGNPESSTPKDAGAKADRAAGESPAADTADTAGGVSSAANGSAAGAHPGGPDGESPASGAASSKPGTP